MEPRREIAPGVYHWRDGWHFGRNGDGSVTIFRYDDGVPTQAGPIPAAEWASIVVAVSTHDDGRTYAIALALHGG